MWVPGGREEPLRHPAGACASMKPPCGASQDKTGPQPMTPCPKRAARTIHALMAMDEGEVLVFAIHDGEPVSRVPEFASVDGHVIVARNQLPDTRWEQWIRVESPSSA